MNQAIPTIGPKQEEKERNRLAREKRGGKNNCAENFDIHYVCAIIAIACCVPIKNKLEITDKR